MSQRTFDTVVCSCGHTGQIVFTENDTPYSSDFWGHYSLRELNSNGKPIPDNAEASDIFEMLDITCPKCNAVLTSNNLR